MQVGRCRPRQYLLAQDPFQSPPHFEKLVGDLEGAFSRRINIQHRLVYLVLEDRNTGTLLLLDQTSAAELSAHVGQVLLVMGFVIGSQEVRVVAFRVLSD